ncbi:HAD-IA family hydrolase [Limimaricola hongkongensis]|uniref:Putative phosphoglycolate phosphatase n=1 Tax=Limimaricola hongkongensis DSM 17492 TaxID=1122180 RepID=A0A017HGG7_9RHOB|nr:HAD-IA family hydrolase [Limimaricola hongkongensis]EYD73446.1 putative phosphoglycolate phosphatase [Limimaricola hongkongensis DSM 17492]
MTEPRLVIFDVDGTLVDSQRDILAAMAAAFAAEGLAVPPRERVLSGVGLSLPETFLRLAGAQGQDVRARMIASYCAAYADLRQAHGAESSPFYPGARAALDRLAGEPFTLLAVATGKSRRGLDRLIEAHGLEGLFHSRQTADDHPSKPHPAMIRAALDETGVARARAVMVGDTRFDVEMARAAGIASIGVGWGYQPAAGLSADRIIHDWAGLAPALDELTETNS